MWALLFPSLNSFPQRDEGGGISGGGDFATMRVLAGRCGGPQGHCQALAPALCLATVLEKVLDKLSVLHWEAQEGYPSLQQAHGTA